MSDDETVDPPTPVPRRVLSDEEIESIHRSVDLTPPLSDESIANLGAMFIALGKERLRRLG